VQAPAHVWGEWDQVRLEQVVTNLVTNAIKYGGEKPIAISVERKGDMARLTVSDQGIGISEADQQRLFKPFERATDLHQGRSLGLGLYLVREIVNAHGGHVRLSSQPGAGTTVVVELPLGLGREIADANILH
jgi:signal transduction histidine kinase